MTSTQPIFDLNLAKRLAQSALEAYDTPAQIMARNAIPIYFAPLDLQGFIQILPNAVILAIRGTASLKNWEVDVNAIVISPGIHAGFDEGYEGLRPKILNALPRTNVGDIDRTKPFYITGHSLGGAIAARAADDLGCTVCITFGQPRLYHYHYIRGNWTTLSKVNLWRVVDHEDIVAHVPGLLLGYRHFGGLALISSLGDFEINPPLRKQIRGHARGISADLCRIFTGKLPQGVIVKEHLMAQYVRALGNIQQ